jgi:hypothetical protein
MLAGSLAGGIDPIAFRLFWGLAPDLLTVAVLVPLLLLAAGIATLLEHRAVTWSSSTEAGLRKTPERV